MSELSDAQKRRYARQVSLQEIGSAGQAQLCAAEFGVADDADARAANVARDYLLRAGLREGVAPALPVASGTAVRALAGDAALEQCAAWLAGSFAAVEAIKRVTGAGTPAGLDATFSLTGEPD